MKQRTQILALGLAGAVFAAAVGGIGLMTNRSLQADIEAALQASHALQASQAADMMHDAIRGDAQLALLGAAENKPDRIAQAAAALKEHAETMHKELAALRALPLSAESLQAIERVQPLVKGYIDAATLVVQQPASRDPAARSQLQSTFDELEDRLAALSDSIERSGVTRNAQAAGAVQRAAWAIASALAVTVVAMLLLALWLARHMGKPMSAAVQAAGQLAHGDLTVRIAPMGNDETVQLLESLQRMREGFERIVRDVKANAESVATASAQIAQGNADLSGRTEQQAASLQQAASSMEQLGSTVRQNADNAAQANQLAQGASNVAMKGGEVVGQVVTMMSGINESSRRIADITGVIDGIAFQTNILALNAAVESARAGEHGRGFAVVANEVRGLAQRSSAAAKEIKELITASVERVQQGSLLVNEAGTTMGEIVGSIRRVTDIMGEISAASAEQSAGVAQVGEAVSQMDQTTQRNASLVEQSAAAADLMQGQAQALVRAVAAFRLA